MSIRLTLCFQHFILQCRTFSGLLIGLLCKEPCMAGRILAMYIFIQSILTRCYGVSTSKSIHYSSSKAFQIRQATLPSWPFLFDLCLNNLKIYLIEIGNPFRNYERFLRKAFQRNLYRCLHCLQSKPNSLPYSNDFTWLCILWENKNVIQGI